MPPPPPRRIRGFDSHYGKWSSNTTGSSGTAMTPQKWSVLYASASINGATGLFCVALFCILRLRLPSVYAARSKAALFLDTHTNAYLNNRRGRSDARTRRLLRPDALGQGFFAWLWPLLTMSEEDTFASLGLDAVVHVKTFLLLLQIFVVLGVVALVGKITGVWHGRVSLSDVPYTGHGEYWGYLAMVYVSCATTGFFVWRHYRSYVDLRQRYLAGRRSTPGVGGVHLRSLLVTCIPAGSRNGPGIQKYFMEHYSGFSSCWLFTRPVSRPYVVSKRRALQDRIKALEAAGAAAVPTATQEQRRASSFRQLLSAPQQELAAAQAELRDLEGSAAAADQAKVGPGGSAEATARMPLAMAVATFETPRQAHVAAQALGHVDVGTWKVVMAPAPTDVLWQNIEVADRSARARHLCMARTCALRYVVLPGIVLFWFIPVAAISALTTLEHLDSLLPGTVHVLERLKVASVVAGYLPSLALLAFMAMLPYLLIYIVRLEGCLTRSAMDAKLLVRYYAFLVLNVMLFFALGGSLLATVDKVKRAGLKAVPRLLGTTLPGMYFFFVCYVMLKAFTVFPIELVRAATILSQQSKHCARSPGAKEKALAAGGVAFGHGIQLANHLLIFSVGVTYSTISPIVVPFVLVYAVVGLVVTRHHLRFVWVASYESGGALWPSVVACAFVGQVIHVLTLVGVFFLKGATLQGYLACPLLVCLPGFYYFGLRRTFGRPEQFLALSTDSSDAFVPDGGVASGGPEGQQPLTFHAAQKQFEKRKSGESAVVVEDKDGNNKEQHEE